MHSITRKFFGWAVEQEIIPASPVAGLKAPAEEKSRDRILDDRELAAVWAAAGQVDPIYGALVRLLILTGQRRGEIAGLTWDEIDGKKLLITLPRERVKNDRAHEVPLSPQAMAVIEGLPRTSKTYVFSMAGKGPINGFGKPKTRLDKLCGFDDWVLHDIRRSVATGMAETGIQPHIIEAVLNHVSGHKAGVAGIYNRSQYATEKRAALEAWAKHVSTIVAPKIAKAAGQR